MTTNKNNITISDNYVISTPEVAIEPTESIGSILFANLKANEDQIAQIDAKTGQEETFGQVLQHSIRTALHMSDKKITRQDVITLCTKNHLNAPIPFIAIQFLGAKLGPVDPSFSLEEMNHLLNTVRPKMIFTKSVSVPLLEESLKAIALDAEIVVFDRDDQHTPFSDFLKPHPEENNFEPVKIDNLRDTAIIYFSSGTTGLPKGICLSHYSLVGHILNTRFTECLDMELMKVLAERICLPMTYIAYTSFYWISAGSILISSILEGHCRLICEEFNGEEIWDYIEKYKPAVIMLTPVQVIEMLSRKKSVNVRSVCSIPVIGSALPKEYIMKLKQAFPEADIYSGYGQTEVSGPVVMFKPMDKNHRELSTRPDKIGSVGLPMKGVAYKVVDTDTGKNLPPNQQGELCLKCRFLMNGYYNLDSSETFDEDGWLKTGDIVYYDEDFCFYIVDRIKEAFKYQGWFIAPTIIENELIKHPAVKLAVVIGIPKDDGDHPMALVILNDGFQVSEEEIEKFVAEKVSERQRLRAGVKFIKDVPVTATGKVKRNVLKVLVLQGKL